MPKCLFDELNRKGDPYSVCRAELNRQEVHQRLKSPCGIVVYLLSHSLLQVK